MSATPDVECPDPEANPYLSGNYAPVVDEVTAVDLPVEGALPPELCGRYLRNGPNPAGPVDGATHHWFAGDGMVHGVRLRDGRAEWYRNRYVGSTRLAALRGEADVAGPDWSGSPTGPNTNVIAHAGRTWAIVEAGGCPVELGYELDTVARNDFSGTLPGAFTAHPKPDPATGELHAVVYAPAQWPDHVQYVVVGVDGRVRLARDLTVPGMPMVHDLSLTSTWALVYDQPCTVDVELALAGRFPFRWNPDHGNRVGLVPRAAAEDPDADLDTAVVWIDVPLGYSYHPLNAHDTADGRVVVDLCVYDVMFDHDRRGPFGDGLARLERWELDPSRRAVAVTVVDEAPNEFPRHRESVGTSVHRYGYCTSISTDPAAGWPTLKHDLRTGERHRFDHGPGRAAGEAVFVPRSPDGAEDDGWLLTFVHDLGAGAAELVVLDAAEFAGRGEVARVRLPGRVPFGFHGNWIGDDEVAPPGG